MAPERVPLAKAAKELGVSLREMQRLLAHAGVSAQKGAALLLPSQIEKAREQQSRERAGQLLATQQWLKPQPVVNVQLSEEEPRPVQPTEPKKRLIECPCCSVSLRWLPPDAESGDDQAMCAACEPHHSLENEPESRRWERLEEHTNRLRRAYEATEIHAHRLEVQCGRASEQLNKWRGTDSAWARQIMILLDHAPPAMERTPVLSVTSLTRAARSSRRSTLGS